MINSRLDGLAEALFREAGDALILFEPESGQVVEVNPTAERLSGFSRAELLNMQTANLLQAEGVESQSEMHDAEQRTQIFHARDGFLLRTRQENTWIPVNLTISRLHLQAQTLGLITARDVRDYREAYVKLRKFETEMRRVLTSVTDYLWSAKIDSQGRWSYRYCSPVVETITGRSPRYFIDFVGEPKHIRWGKIVDPADRPQWETLIQKLMTGKSVQEEYRIVRSDGQVRWVRENVRVNRGENSSVLLLDGVVTDVTPWRNHEAELRSAKEAAEAASRAKSEFLANMSHEIRTPLNGIIGMADLAMRSVNGSEQRCYLDSLQLSAQSLLTVINDILDFSKIEAGKLEIEVKPFSIRESVADALSVLAVRAHQKGLELSCHIRSSVPDSICGDAARLKQVLVNLVGNAVKFTRTGSILVDIYPIGDQSSVDEVTLVVQVSDTGIGIPPEKRSAIFEAFVQADLSSTREFGGTGLGLAIASALVRRMGGRISVDSEVGVGSKFVFTVCLKAERKPAVSLFGPAQLAGLQGRRVLIVDPSSHTRHLLSDVLTGWGMLPTAVSDPELAQEACKAADLNRRPYDLFLLDSNTPSGTPILPYWRSFSSNRNASALGKSPIPTVLLLTTANLGEDASQCRALAVDAYVTKPIRESTLLSILAAVLLPPLPRALPEASQVESNPRLRVLLAEDNPVNQLYAATLLEQSGHNVRIARSGREALMFSKEESFDLALMDIEMPEMDGFAATRAIRELEQGKNTHLPIIALTAHAVKGFREQCLAAGMDGYLSKPIRAQELLDAIYRAVRPPHAEQVEDPQPDPQSISISGNSDQSDPAKPAVETPAPLAFCRESALARVEGDQATFRALIALYFLEMPIIQSRLQRAMDEKQQAKAREAALVLAGIVATFSADRAREIALRLAKTAGDPAWATSSCKELDRAIHELNLALRPELKSAIAC